MSVNLSAFAGAGWQFFNDNGDPLTGGKLYTYAAGTTTPAVTYTSQDGGTAHSNPIILDAAGRVADEIWLTSDATYKFQLKDANDVLIGTYDNIYGVVGADIPGTVNVENFTGNGTQTTFILSAPPGGVNNTQVFINGVYQFKNTYAVSGSTLTFTQAPPPAASKIEVLRFSTFSVGTLNADQVIYDPAGTGAVATTVQAKLRETVSVKDFGAVCDGVTDDTAAVQAAVDYCATFGFYWPTLVIPGRCKLESSVNIDRPVDNTKTEFIILGQGPGAGFYGTGTITFFDSTIPMAAGSGTAPVSEFVTFENINFEASSFFDECFVISRKFLRIKFLNCFFWLTRCQVSDTYTQTIYFVACNIRNNKTNFINTAGLYDVVFDSCIIENGSTIIRSIDPAYGTSGLRFVNSVIEGIGLTSVVVAAGVSAFDLIGCHLEANFSPEFNFFAAGPVNTSVNVIGNYIFNPAGVTFYYGPTTNVFSSGNTAFPSVLHSNVGQVANLISCGDTCVGGISDAGAFSVVNGVYRAGTTGSVWSDSANQITKDVNGNFGINIASSATTKFLVKGISQLSTSNAGGFLDSAGNTIINFRNDRVVEIPALQNAVNDAAAAALGIPVGGLYRNASAVQVRVT